MFWLLAIWEALLLVITIGLMQVAINQKLVRYAVKQGGVALGHKWSDATCTEAKTCTVCGKTEGVALGHTTETGTCDRCGESFSKWELGEYVDEFKIPTGDKYIITSSTGVFSNSATNNSELYASVQIDRNKIGIMLWEYGSHLVKGIFDYENYEITILDTRGTRYTFTGTIYDGGTRIYFRNADRARIVNILKQEGTVKFYLKTTKYSVSTYLFDVDTAGFEEAYAEIN